jgi:hypothetical protein
MVLNKADGELLICEGEEEEEEEEECKPRL